MFTNHTMLYNPYDNKTYLNKIGFDWFNYNIDLILK